MQFFAGLHGIKWSSLYVYSELYVLFSVVFERGIKTYEGQG